MMDAMSSCEETIGLGDRDYDKKNRTIDEFEKEGYLPVLTPRSLTKNTEQIVTLFALSSGARKRLLSFMGELRP